MTRRVVTLALVAALAGCAPVGPDYVRPDVHVPPAYGEPNAAAPAPALTPLPVDWWKLYHDPVLDGLAITGSSLVDEDKTLADGSVTVSTAAAQSAASQAFPPPVRTSIAAREACGFDVTTTPLVPRATGLRPKYGVTISGGSGAPSSARTSPGAARASAVAPAA